MVKFQLLVHYVIYDQNTKQSRGHGISQINFELETLNCE